MNIGDMIEKDKIARSRNMDHHRMRYRDGVVYGIRSDRMFYNQEGSEDERDVEQRRLCIHSRRHVGSRG